MSYLASDAAWFFAFAVWCCCVVVAVLIVLDEVRHRGIPTVDLRVAEREARENAAPLSSAVDRVWR